MPQNTPTLNDAASSRVPGPVSGREYSNVGGGGETTVSSRSPPGWIPFSIMSDGPGAGQHAQGGEFLGAAQILEPLLKPVPVKQVVRVERDDPAIWVGNVDAGLLHAPHVEVM